MVAIRVISLCFWAAIACLLMVSFQNYLYPETFWQKIAFIPVMGFVIMLSIGFSLAGYNVTQDFFEPWRKPQNKD